MEGGAPLHLAPFGRVNARLAQQLAQQRDAYVGAMRVGDAQSPTTAIHELVLGAHERAFETERAQTTDKLAPADRPQDGTHATSLIISSRPSIAGKGSWRETRKRIHSSKTSSNSSRHVSRFGAFAQTPSKPGISPKIAPSSRNL
jgi:hypothetical protein